jgi:beta-lactamase regulating signal transducer with metallopeptidase domain
MSTELFAPLPADTYLAGVGGPLFQPWPPVHEEPSNSSAATDSAEGTTTDSSWSISWGTVFPYVLGAYLTGAALVACRWLLGLVGVWWMLRSAVQPPRRVQRQFLHMTRHLRHKPRVLASRKLRVPVSCGFWRPTVVLPASLCRKAEKPRLAWVFAHELTHLKRGDAWSGVLMALGSAIYYFCPWFWGLRRQVRLCQEYVADAAAVSHDARHEDYAQFLLGLASAPAGPALAMSVRGTASDLFRRVTMLLQDPIRVERRCSRLWCVGTALSLLAVAVFVAGIGAAPDARAATPDKQFIADDEKDPAKDDTKPSKEKRKEEIKKKIELKMADLVRLILLELCIEIVFFAV